MKKAAVVMSALMVWLVVNPSSWSQEKDRAELAKAVAVAKVSLEQGLSTSAHEGKPISAKFEIEDGKLQLSVYTAKGDSFSEVVVDHTTGKAAKTEPITFAAPYYRRFAQNRQVKAFVQGVTAAAVGAIAGAAVILTRRAVFDLPTVLIALISLGVLLAFKKVPEPVLILGAGVAGIVLHRSS